MYKDFLRLSIRTAYYVYAMLGLPEFATVNTVNVFYVCSRIPDFRDTVWLRYAYGFGHAGRTFLIILIAGLICCYNNITSLFAKQI